MSEAESESAPLPPAGEQPRKKTATQRVWVAATSAIAVLGVLIGIVQIVQVWTRDTTNFSHLTMSASLAEDEVTEWALNPELLERGVPFKRCDDGAREWLAENAVQLHRRYTLSVRNSASEGPMLALLDFRSTAPPVKKRSTIHVRFVCDPRAELPDQLSFGRLDADRGDLTAYHVVVERDGPIRSTVVRPVGFNLAPGESGMIQLELFSKNQAEGSIEVSVLSRDETRTQTIDGTSFSIPALLYSGDMYLAMNDEGLVCERIERESVRSCSLEELQAELASAASSD